MATARLIHTVAAFFHNADYTLNVVIAFLTHVIFSVMFIFKYTSFLYKMKVVAFTWEPLASCSINFCRAGTIRLVGPEVVTHVFSQHARILFQIVCFRIKTAFIQPSGISDFEKSKLVADKLISATKLHKETMKFVKLYANCLTTSYVVLMILGVTSFTLNLLRMSQSLRGQWKFEEIWIQMLSISVHIVYLFMANYLGQIVTDSSSNVFTELHNSRWYTASERTQKLLLFFIQHCTKTYTVVLWGLYPTNFEGFSALVRASFSYFAVMYSMQT
ncbi:uncharacterized protein LOC117223921 isoform X5 [Megalopta genalis]|uniref:uncharacterized protein LOC117223921 isoform X5 n=1 Tax=Megalopta genalis TaxID=115081 RepID=UPI003FD549E4